MTGDAELPLRVVDTPAGPVIRGLCGLEAAILDPRRRQDPTRVMAPDVSPAALMRMVLHARRCQACLNRAAELRRAAELAS